MIEPKFLMPRVAGGQQPHLPHLPQQMTICPLNILCNNLEERGRRHHRPLNPLHRHSHRLALAKQTRILMMYPPNPLCPTSLNDEPYLGNHVVIEW